MNSKTDKGSEAVERSLRAFSYFADSLYTEAEKEAYTLFHGFIRRFKEQDEKMIEQVKAGTIEESDWDEWRRRQFSGKEWESLLDRICAAINAANVEAIEKINEEIAAVYAENHNWGVYLAEKQLDSRR